MAFANDKLIAAALLVGLIGGAYLLRDAVKAPAPAPAPAPPQTASAPAQPPAVVAQPQSAPAQPQSAPAATLAAPQAAAPVGPAENLAWPSEDLSDPRYKPDDATVVAAKDDNAPAGIKAVNRLTEGNGKGLHRAEILIEGLHPGAVYTTSLFVKPVERSGILLELRDDDKAKRYGTARFDLKRGKMAKAGDVVNTGVEAIPGGWYRIWAEMPYSTERGVMNFTLLGDDGAPSYAGDGKSGLLVSGFQVNPGVGPAAYVATTIAPVSSR